ncbi:methyl-accepting chemotaxis protein [Sphingobium subterraneum]|uniref:Methyl-accepting chemotaxis protein n=1 Tax=Sphingobium subterraneum TaxID=627688 RepID=A0A841J9L6_9SPHN|nr:methyl-accepting chemotaxis protein [Sphingobium subterraneum]MBB6125195.1 methyl-accepting chemotaxis protein [Sphingobium subterraneum]
MTRREGLARNAMMISLALLILVVACGGIGIGAAFLQRSAMRQQTEVGLLMRRHMMADMMHDAVRSDALAIVLASSNPASAVSLADARKDLNEHLQTLRSSIAAERIYDGSRAVTRASTAIATPLAHYATAAQDIADIAARDPQQAFAHLPAFFEQFRALEVSMEDVSVTIERHAADVEHHARWLARTAIILVIGGLAAATGGVLFVMRMVRLRLIHPLVDLTAATAAMAVGDLHVAMPCTDRADELGTLATTVATFQQSLLDAQREREEQARMIVDSIGSALGDLAKGDLTAHIDADLAGIFVSLRTDFNSAIASLRSLLGAILGSSGVILSGAQEITQASDDLARRTENNAAHLEETSATLSGVDMRIRSAAEAAANTADLTNRASEATQEGHALAAEAVEAMGRVSDSAKGIDAVIDGLDRIAFQTRILAMNAAVEAGRAGEAGRGFAVVADMVSSLALRAEEEAQQARDQLTVTQTEVATAVHAVEQVGTALTTINEQVDEVRTLVVSMAEDNQAQSEAISQIATAVGTLDTSTQQNAAMVEQASAAARTLCNEANALADRASQFRTQKEEKAGRRTIALAA